MCVHEETSARTTPMASDGYRLRTSATEYGGIYGDRKVEISSEKSSADYSKALWMPKMWQARHIDDGFFENIVINAEVTKRSYWSIMWSACKVTQQISLVAIVASTAYSLFLSKVSSRRLMFLEVVNLVVMAVMKFSLMRKSDQKRAVFISIGQWLLLLLLALSLVPVFATLASSIAADTIVFTSASLFCVHLYSFRGFQLALSTAGRHPYKNMGLVAAVTSCILISSRLHTYEDVFALIFLSIQVFIIAPSVQFGLRLWAPYLYAILTALVVAIAAALLSEHSVLLTSSFLCTIVFVTFLCPMWMVRVHKFKTKINGPWDEAEPKLGNLLKDKVA